MSHNATFERESFRPIVWAAATTALALSPVWYVGALAVQIREDIALGPSELGVAVGVFFATSALASIPLGRWIEGNGAPRAVLLTGVLSTAGALGIALLARSLSDLLAFLVVAGIGNAAAQPATNIALTRAIVTDRHGIAFGTKQAAVPAATLLAGLAVPTLGLTIGWRWAFASLVIGWLAVSATAKPMLATGEPRQVDWVPPRLTAGLILLASAALLGSAFGTALATFAVEFAVAVGVSLGAAGLVLAVGSAAGVGIRIGAGWAADKVALPLLPAMCAQLVVGAAAALLAAGFQQPIVASVSIVLAYAAGWGWPGLLTLAVIRAHPLSPAYATSVLMTGTYTGGVVGPAVFGRVVESHGYSSAWAVMSLFLLSAGLLAVLASLRSR